MINEEEKVNLPRDLVIPTKLAFSKEIEDEYKFLYAYISFRASTRGYIWYQNETLAEHLGKSLSSIKRGLKALREAKWIKVENRVKKSDLHHQSMNRVIWVYADYLVALEKGGYGIARPLVFSTWKRRFINAIIDSSKIPMLMHFFPLMEKMGKMGINLNPTDKTLHAYTTNELQTYDTRIMTPAESDKAYKELYEFYESLHNKLKDYGESIIDFTKFQDHFRNKYIDVNITIDGGKQITVNAMGLLMLHENSELRILKTDEATELWQWLFDNQQDLKIGEEL